MAGSEKSNSIVSSFSSLLLEAWNKWDVRGMVLFSLCLQISLSVLGKRRKYKIHPFCKTILWFAYLGADWIAIATLGKLSSSYVESPTTKILRAYWAPLLLLHLGGSDTITAYSFEDNKLWIRHLLTLVVKTILVIYIVFLSWTFSWLSFLSLPLVLAEIIKYIERILCLKLINSQDTRPIISSTFDPFDPKLNVVLTRTLDHLVQKHPNELRAYLLFTVLRPDVNVNDYLSFQKISSVLPRILTYFQKIGDKEGDKSLSFVRKYVMESGPEINFFDAFAVEVGFIFDVVYTKAVLIYSNLGCLLRLISFASSFSVLLLFCVCVIDEPKFHFSRVDIAITSILLSGAIALDVYAAWVMLSSDWAVLVAAFHRNVLLRKTFSATLNCFPCLLHQNKRWSDHMGQFDLLEYCWRWKEKKGNQSCGLLRKITNYNDIIEMWHKYRLTKFVKVDPSLLKVVGSHVREYIDMLFRDISFQPSRGEKALTAQQCDHLKWSTDEADFDYSIIIWHLATSVFCLQEAPNAPNKEAMEISEWISNYMSYLLAMCPTLILPNHSKSFWLDCAYVELKDFLSSATDIIAASKLLFGDRSPRASWTKFQHLDEDVFRLAKTLQESENKWEMIKKVWLEMLVYAAVSSQHNSHVKQVGEGIEFLSILWLRLAVGGGPALI